MSKKEKPWLADDGTVYHGKDPYFYDPKQFAWVEEIESHWETFRDELMNVAKNAHDNMDPYPDLEKTDKKDAWHTAGMMYWTMRSKKNIKLFPKTWAIMSKIPSISSCSFHELAPHSTIKPHIGDTNMMVRCHMGIQVPAPLPKCGIRVGNEKQCWENGKILMFNDAHEHTAWNNSDEYRYILSFDVIQPKFEGKRFWVASQILGKIYVEVLYQHKAWLRKFFSAKWQKAILFSVYKSLFRVAVFVKSFGKY
ncbi:aspartyl/asparaginyl beta-hydroxylase domain-containing protein [Alteromonas sp. a30]|uniref:aspartyl/asparaginyl beta-hydroxylase domain-containing protein n=1 Tax=Alteromonas sp. a30 TaxID=2730917 RepID=UPI002282FC7C|nr:aspartyl/asparaginyl beta-hydroxylase domain-containing protein [Alteromonas sp. a30]MCY7294917.1 aspartyl/asparaginyl beta-hydroxylase domain-containing protein [Alteromonas sp. a30]